MARNSVLDRLSVCRCRSVPGWPGFAGRRSWVLALALGGGMDAGMRPGCRDLPRPDRAGSFAAHPALAGRRGDPAPLGEPSRCPALVRRRAGLPGLPARRRRAPARRHPDDRDRPAAGRERRRPAGSHARRPVAVERRPDRVSRFAIVETPGQSYAVAMLPRYARAFSHERRRHSASTAGRQPPPGTTGIASMLGLNAPAADWSINGIPANELSQWYKTGTQEISHLTSLGCRRVSKSLGLKVTPTSRRAEPRGAIADPAVVAGVRGPLPVPAPEPATWLVFGLILGAAGLRRRGRPRMADTPDLKRSTLVIDVPRSLSSRSLASPGPSPARFHAGHVPTWHINCPSRLVA